jgi:DNA-binding response OmpR family regulator
LALLLRTTLELQGYDVEDSIDTESSVQPAILIVDSGDNLEELEFCKKLRCNPNFANSKIIVTTSVHDKSAVLDSGVDLYLPKPYEITDLIQWIEYFMKNMI